MRELNKPDNGLTVGTVCSWNDLGGDSEHDTGDTRCDTREDLTSNYSSHASGGHGDEGANSEENPCAKYHVTSSVNITDDGKDGTKRNGRDGSSLDDPNPLACGSLQSSRDGILIGSRGDTEVCVLNGYVSLCMSTSMDDVSYLESCQCANGYNGPGSPRNRSLVIRILSHCANDCNLLIFAIDGVRVDYMRVGESRDFRMAHVRLVHCDGVCV